VYAEEGDGGSGQLWCNMCNKPFPCGYEYDDTARKEVTTHVDEGGGNIVEYVFTYGGGTITTENPTATIDTGAGSLSGGQSQGGDVFSGLDGTAGSASGDSDAIQMQDGQTPAGVFNKLVAMLPGFVGDTMLDEEGGARPWVLWAGVIIIALIALGVVTGVAGQNKKRRRKQARS